MRLRTIWTLPGLPLGERINRTYDVLCLFIAHHMPTRLRYWTYIAAGSKVIKSDEEVPAANFTTLLSRMEY